MAWWWWKGGAGWSGPEVTLREGLGEAEERVKRRRKKRNGGRGERGGSFPLFSSRQLFYEGRNIIFSTQASPRRDP